MADWVHCNACFHPPGDGRKFSLTNCGHIYCANCSEQSTKPKCRVCSASCTTIHLSSKMKPDVEVFFTDPGDIVKNHHKKLTQLVCHHLKELAQVLDFQKNHRQRLTQYRIEKLSKQSAALGKSHISVEQYHDLERENLLLREEIVNLKRLIIAGKGGQHSRTSSGKSPYIPREQKGTSPSPLGTSPYTVGSAIRYQAKTVHEGREYHSTQKTPTGLMKRRESPHTPVTMSGRISVRTPPIGGRIGHIPGTPVPVPYYATRTGTTPHIPINSLLSPAYSQGSPMSTSPGSQRHRSPARTPSKSYPSRLTPRLLSSQNSTRQIQLPCPR